MIDQQRFQEVLRKSFPVENEIVSNGKRLTIGQQKEIHSFSRGYIAALRTDEEPHVPAGIVIRLMSGRIEELFKSSN